MTEEEQIRRLEEEFDRLFGPGASSGPQPRTVDLTGAVADVAKQTAQELHREDKHNKDISSHEVESSQRSESHQRIPLEEIIGHYGIAGIHPATNLLPE